MVQRYRAGTAFVEVVPSFKGMQKDIARHFRENLRKELSDKKAFEGLEKNLERAFAKGIEGASESTRKKIREVLLEIENDTGKSAERSVKKIREMTKDIGGAFEADIRKAGKALQKSLGENFGRGLAKEHHDLRGQVRKDLDLLAKAYTDGGVQNEREIRRAYERMEKNLKKFQDLPSISSATRGNAARGLEALDSGEYLRTLRNMNAAEVKAHRDHQREMHNAEVAANRKTEGEQERHNQKMASVDAAEAKRRHAADAAAKARRTYNQRLSSRRNAFKPLEREGERTTRTDRLAGRVSAEIGRAQAQVTSFMRDIQRLDGLRPRILVDTDEGVRNMRDFQRQYRLMAAGIQADRIPLEVDVEKDHLYQEVERLKKHAEMILSNVDMEVDIEDEEARRDIQRLRGMLEELDSLDVESRVRAVGVDGMAREIRDVRGDLERLERGVTEVDIVADTHEAAGDIRQINAALATLRDRTVGVDIREEEALAALTIIDQAADRASRDRHMDIKVDYDRSHFSRLLSGLDGARLKIGRLNRALADSKISMSDTTQAFRLFSPILTGIIFAGGPLVSLLGGVAGGLGAVASAVPGVIGGVLPLVAAFGDLSEASGFYEAAQEAAAVAAEDRTDKQKEALKVWEAEKEALGEATAAWVEFTQEFGPRLDGIREAAREGLFPGLMDGIDTLMKYEGQMTEFMGRMSELFGNTAERWSNMLTTPLAQEWFGRVAEDSEMYTSAIIMSVENIVGAFANLTDAFRPFAREFMAWLVNSSQRFEDWAGGLADSPKFNQFLDSIRNVLPLLGDFTKNVGELFVNLVIAVEPFSVAILDAVNHALDFINALDPDVLSGILGAVGGLAGGLMILAGVMAGVGAAAAVMWALSGSLMTQVAASLGLFIAVNSTAIGAMAATGSTATVLGDAAAHVGRAFEGVADFGRSLWGTLGDLLDAIEPLLPTVAELAAKTLEAGTFMGGIFLEAVGLVIDLVGVLVDVFTMFPTPIQESVLVLLGLSAVLLKFPRLTQGVLKGLSLLGTGFKAAFDGVGTLATKVGELGMFVNSNGPVTILTTGVRGIGTGAMKAVGGVKKLWGSLSSLDRASIIIGAIAAAFTLMRGAMEKAFNKLDTELTDLEAVSARLDGMDKSAQGAAGALDELFYIGEKGKWDEQAVSVLGVDDAIQVLSDRTGTTTGKFEELFSEINRLGQDTELDKIQAQVELLDESMTEFVRNGDLDTAADAFREFADSAVASGEDIDWVIEQFPGLHAELKATADRLGETELTSRDYYNWMRGEVPLAIDEAIEAHGMEGEALSGVRDETQENIDKTRELIDARNELNGFAKDAITANAEYQESLRQLDEVVANGAETFDINTEAGKKNWDIVKGLGDDAWEMAEANLAAGESVGVVGQSMIDEYDALYDFILQLTGSEEKARELTDAIYEIPPGVEPYAYLQDNVTHIADNVSGRLEKLDEESANPETNAKGADTAKGKIENVHEALLNLPPETNPKVDADDGPARSTIEELWDWIRSTTVWFKAKVRRPDDAIGNPDMPSNWSGGGTPAAMGGIFETFARGGLKPMEPVAQMVKPNTWRVVGDRMRDDEAYIPLDGSARSKSILFEAISRMPGLFMEHGGIVGFANGAVASAAPSASAAEGEESAELAQVSEAFAALEAALREGFGALLADLLGMSQEFFAQLMVAHLAYNEQTLAASALFRETETARDSEWRALETETLLAHQAATSSAEATHQGALAQSWSTYRSTQASHWADHRSNDLSAASTYFSELQSRTGSAQSTLRSSWATTFDQISSIASTFRSNELSDMQGFHNENARMITSFGTGARTEWSRIWRDLRDNAKSIFGEVPGDIGGILVDVSKKLNKHIVDPFNKIIKDLDLKDIDQLGSFPTQSHATGGHIALRDGGMMSGYTPGRDVHRFVSPTGGILELSGGEPVLRPEVGAVLGEDWVNKVNATARNQGVQGVKNLFGGGAGQAFADGGVWRNLWGIVHEQFPNARLTSAKRNGSGGSYHNTGRAIDVAGPTPMDVPFMKRIYEFIHDNYGNSSELIFTPGGGKNILNGAYHTYNAATRANHRDHVHWANTHRFSDVVGPPTGGSAMGLYDIAGNMESWIKKASDSMGEGFLPDVAMGSFSNLFTEVAKQKQDAFITDHSHLAIDPGGPGGGVARWSSLVRQALEHMNQPTSEAMINTVLRRMRQESNGNPRAINLWDSNARRGTPSKGLMQVIDPTFQANRDRSLGNDIWDPFQNIVASMRYALGRYGSLPAAYNKSGGYAEGGMIDLNPEVLFRDGGGSIPTGYSIVHNNLTHEETALPYTTAQVTKEFQRLQEIDHQPVDQSVRFDNVRFEGDPDQMYETAMRHQRVASINRPMKI